MNSWLCDFTCSTVAVLMLSLWLSPGVSADPSLSLPTSECKLGVTFQSGGEVNAIPVWYERKSSPAKSERPSQAHEGHAYLGRGVLIIPADVELNGDEADAPHLWLQQQVDGNTHKLQLLRQDSIFAFFNTETAVSFLNAGTKTRLCMQSDRAITISRLSDRYFLLDCGNGQEANESRTPHSQNPKNGHTKIRETIDNRSDLNDLLDSARDRFSTSFAVPGSSRKIDLHETPYNLWIIDLNTLTAMEVPDAINCIPLSTPAIGNLSTLILSDGSSDSMIVDFDIDGHLEKLPRGYQVLWISSEGFYGAFSPSSDQYLLGTIGPDVIRSKFYGEGEYILFSTLRYRLVAFDPRDAIALLEDRTSFELLWTGPGFPARLEIVPSDALELLPVSRGGLRPVSDLYFAERALSDRPQPTPPEAVTHYGIAATSGHWILPPLFSRMAARDLREIDLESGERLFFASIGTEFETLGIRVIGNASLHRSGLDSEYIETVSSPSWPNTHARYLIGKRQQGHFDVLRSINFDVIYSIPSLSRWDVAGLMWGEVDFLGSRFEEILSPNCADRFYPIFFDSE